MLKDSNFSLNKESFWLFVVRVALCDGSAMFWVVPLSALGRTARCTRSGYFRFALGISFILPRVGQGARLYPVLPRVGLAHGTTQHRRAFHLQQAPPLTKEGFGEEYEYKRAPALHSFYM